MVKDFKDFMEFISKQESKEYPCYSEQEILEAEYIENSLRKMIISNKIGDSDEQTKS